MPAAPQGEKQYLVKSEGTTFFFFFLQMESEMKSLAEAAGLLPWQISSNIIKPAFSLDTIRSLLFLLPMSLIVSAAEVLTCKQKRRFTEKSSRSPRLYLDQRFFFKIEKWTKMTSNGQKRRLMGKDDTRLQLFDDAETKTDRCTLTVGWCRRPTGAVPGR